MRSSHYSVNNATKERKASEERNNVQLENPHPSELRNSLSIQLQVPVRLDIITSMECPEQSSGAVTQLLINIRAGDSRAESDLYLIVYEELRRLARYHMRGEAPGHLLQPTALVNESYVRLVGALKGGEASEVNLKNRSHFLAVAARTMRRILVDYARGRDAERRGGDVVHISLSHVRMSPGDQPSESWTWDNVLLVNDALDKLGEEDDYYRRLVELRFFAGLDVEEAARVLGSSVRQVSRDWEFARTHLFCSVSGQVAPRKTRRGKSGRAFGAAAD